MPAEPEGLASHRNERRHLRSGRLPLRVARAVLRLGARVLGDRLRCPTAQLRLELRGAGEPPHPVARLCVLLSNGSLEALAPCGRAAGLHEVVECRAERLPPFSLAEVGPEEEQAKGWKPEGLASHAPVKRSVQVGLGQDALSHEGRCAKHLPNLVGHEAVRRDLDGQPLAAAGVEEGLAAHGAPDVAEGLGVLVCEAHVGEVADEVRALKAAECPAQGTELSGPHPHLAQARRRLQRPGRRGAEVPWLQAARRQRSRHARQRGRHAVARQ
mmetsp:Transcript_107453/g.333936  ORF Transcript_107453/g.333936 Transcript_107453/m.333936 type:complete len:271 (-) Transcript_107453:519-1331(-)